MALLLILTGCTDDPAAPAGSTAEPDDSSSPDIATAVLNEPDPIVLLGEDEDVAGSLSIEISQALFASAPAVVIAQSGDPESIEQGTSDAVDLGVPLLLVEAAQGAEATDDSSAATSGATQDAAEATAQIDEIARLGADYVLAAGPKVEQTLGDLPDAQIVTSADDIPDVSPADGLTDLAVLVPDTDDDASQAAGASAQAAGAEVIPVADADVRADPEAITALAQAQPKRVLAVGAEFGPVDTLTRRVEVASTGVQLPGGGQSLFPGRRLVALYGTPSTAGLGVLGEQDLDASIDRAQELAAEFEPLSDVPTVPAFEIIATVAQGDAGADGDYSGEIGVEELRPWVEKAGEEGVYVVLDLQPGRSTFLDQAKIYEEFLQMPHVGLALDPEWRLTPTQRPLGQIGRVEAAEVNSVIEWLADLTAQEKLPQKLLVLHQFRLSMLQDEDQIETGRDEVQVLIHMDGQGTTGQKDSTWGSVVDAAPEGVPFGWKNFFDEDEPMLTPEETMTREPTPFMISYQ